MTTCVLDACALIALLRNEPGGEDVRALLADEACRCFVHAVNLCEVYYDCLRNYDEARADQMLVDLTACGLSLRDDMDVGFWKKAGHLKARGRISLADTFAVTLAEREQAVLVSLFPAFKHGPCRCRQVSGSASRFRVQNCHASGVPIHAGPSQLCNFAET